MEGSHWPNKNLTYRITKYSTKLNSQQVQAETRKAFRAWSDHTDLTFNPKSTGPVDIEIKFVEGNHGLCSRFDGPGRVLAHANFQFAHFDDSENWSTKIGRGKTNYAHVAAHEFGHSLGLLHSKDPSAIMFAYYSGSEREVALGNDDILVFVLIS